MKLNNLGIIDSRGAELILRSKTSTIFRFFGYLTLIIGSLFLGACQDTTGSVGITPSATPDLIATEVAVQKSAFATLTAEAPTPATPPTDTPASTPTQQTTSELPATATPIPAAPTATPPPAASTAVEALCRVTASGLNLRPGPGVVFEPPLAALPNDLELVPIAFRPVGFPGGQWVEVQTPDGQIGWVSTDPQLIDCNIDFTSLPPGTIPPTPTPPPTPTNPPTPTPTPLLFAVVPVDGTDDNDFLQGRRVILPGLSPGQVTIPPVFRDWLTFRIEAYDIRFGTQDGDGIEQVEITITYEDEDGDTTQVHRRVEGQAGYCPFGGGEPDCTVWVFAEHGYRWPEGQPIFNGLHRVAFDITPRQGEVTQWRWSFNIAGANPAPGSGDVVAEIVQTGLGTNANLVTTDLVFQVRAFHTGYGNHDGAGIDRVRLTILDEHNQVVYERNEQNAAYCAFSGGEPECNRLPLNQINDGFYTLEATAYGVDGQTATVSMEIEIQGNY